MSGDQSETTNHCDCGGRLFYDDVEGTAHCYDCGSHERYTPRKSSEHPGRLKPTGIPSRSSPFITAVSTTGARWYRVEFETETNRGSCSLRATDPMDAAVRFRAENPWLATAYVCAEETESASRDAPRLYLWETTKFGDARIDWRAEIAMQRRKDRRVLWSAIALTLILMGLVLWAFSASAQVRCTTIGRYWTCSDYGSSSNQTVRCSWIGRTYVCN